MHPGSVVGLGLLVLAADPDPALRRFHWSRKSSAGNAELVQAATATSCSATCTRRGVQAWVRPVCLGSENDFVFVSDDCVHVASLFEYPRSADKLAQTQVGWLLVEKQDPRPLELGRLMADPARVSLNGKRLHWLGGVLDEPGVAPRYSADGSGIEFETLERKRLSRSFAQLMDAEPRDAGPTAQVADDLYEWTDAAGTMNVTSLAAVPARYRKGARRLSGEVSVVSAGPVPPARPAPSLAPPRRDDHQEEARWRERFARARYRISELEQQIAAAQAKLTTLQRGRRGMVVPLTAADQERARAVIDGAEAERKKAQEELHSLELEAANTAVPLEWRR